MPDRIVWESIQTCLLFFQTLTPITCNRKLPQGPFGGHRAFSGMSNSM